MVPANLDIEIFRGDDYALIFRMKDSFTNAYNDLTGHTAKAQIRATHDSETVLAEFTATVLDQAVAANLGAVQISLTPAQTAALPLTGGVWDVEVANGTRTWVRTPLAGNVTVLPEVTR